MVFSAALLAGELLGYPHEAAARLRFLRRGVGAPAPAQLAPVTLRLPDAEERAYRAKRFTDSFAGFNVLCVSIVLGT